MSKKNKDKTANDLRAVGDSLLHSITLIHVQGWVFQRRVRLIKELTRSSERRINSMHKSNRSPSETLEFFKKSAGPEGLQHIRDLFTNLSKPSTQRYLGLIVEDSDLPLKTLDKGKMKRILEDDSTWLSVIFDAATCVAYCLVRRALWHQEGLPGLKML